MAGYQLRRPSTLEGDDWRAWDQAIYELKRNAVLDVKADYGAVGDNSTDNFTALNNAASDALAAGGGVVFIPPSLLQYCFATTLPLYSNVIYVLAPGANLKWSGSAGGTMFSQATTGGPIVHSGVIGAHGGRGKIAPNSAADIVFDLHSPQFNIFKGLEIKAARNTAILFKIRTDVSSTAGALDGSQNAIGNLFDDILYSGTTNTLGKVAELTGTSGKVITLNHFHNIFSREAVTTGFDLVDYADSNDFVECRVNLATSNGIGVNLATANTYNNKFTRLAVDTFAGPTGRVCVVFGSSTSRNRLEVYNNPRAEGGLFTDNGAQSYEIWAHSVDTDAPSSGFDVHTKGVVQYGQAVHVKSVSGTYTAGNDDSTILADATSAAFTVTLPAATVKGKRLTIKKSDASANAVTIGRAGSDTIQGATTVALAAQYNSRTLVADGVSVWYVESST